MPGPVGGGASALGQCLAPLHRMAAKRALINVAVLGPRERHAEMLKLDDRRHRILAHIFDRVLVAEPIGALDGVVHVPAPVVLAHIAECSANATLRRYRVAAGREHLRYAGGLQTAGGGAEGGTHSGTAATDDDDIISVIVDRISLAHCRVTLRVVRI